MCIEVAISEMYDALDDVGFTGVRQSHGPLSVLHGTATARERAATEGRSILLPALFSAARRKLNRIADLIARGYRPRQQRRRQREAVLQLPLPLAWA